MKTVLIDKSSGIYAIVNNISNKMYIGSAINLKRRMGNHLLNLKKNRHSSPPLQAAFNKYGEENFSFELLESVSDKTQLVKREQAWVDFLNPEYNICRQMVNTRLGTKASEKTKQKMSGRTPWNKGKKCTEEVRKKLIESHKGIIPSEEARKKRSLALKGRTLSEAQKKMLSAIMKECHPAQRAVINTEYGIFYNSIKSAFASYGQNITFKVFKNRLEKNKLNFLVLDSAKTYKKGTVKQN